MNTTRQPKREVTITGILSQAGATEAWKKAVRLGVPGEELTKCLEDIANQRLPPRPWSMRRRQVEAFAKRLREDAIKITHLSTLHSDVLPGPRPRNPSPRFDQLLDGNPTWNFLLPEMLTHYADNLDRLEIGEAKERERRPRSLQPATALQSVVVDLILASRTGINRVMGQMPLQTAGTFDGNDISLRSDFRFELAATLIQAAYNAGETDRTTDADRLQKAYDRRTKDHVAAIGGPSAVKSFKEAREKARRPARRPKPHRA